MTEIDGIYQHDFIESSNPNEQSLCFICKKPINHHLNYIPNDLLNDAQINNNLINDRLIIIDESNDNKISENKNKDLFDECGICYEKVDKEEKKLN